MRVIPGPCGILAAALLLAWSAAGAAEPLAITSDGWHGWSVAAPAGGVWRCCCGTRNGEHCVPGSGDADENGEVQILARIRQGRTTEIEVLGQGCRATAEEIIDHGRQETGASVAWLLKQVAPGSRAGSEALAAIAAHAGTAAFRAIVSVIESQTSDDLRQEALFWLVQSGSDEGFDYLDRLLTANQD